MMAKLLPKLRGLSNGRGGNAKRAQLRLALLAFILGCVWVAALYG